MVPGHLLFLLLFVALQASHIQAAPWQRSREDVPPERAFPVLPRPPALDLRGHPRAVLVGDEYRVLWPNPPHKPQGDSKDVALGDGYPFFQLRSIAEHPKDHTDKPSEKALPALLQPPVLDPSWHPRGTQRARYTARRGKKSHKISDILDKTVKKLVQIDFDPSAKSKQKEGSHRMPPVSDVERKAMHATSTVVDSGKNTKAGRNRRLRIYITMSSVVPMVLLSLRLTLLLGKLYQKKNELMKEKEKQALGQANTASASTGEDQTGNAASREEQNDTLTQEDENINNSLSP